MFSVIEKKLHAGLAHWGRGIRKVGLAAKWAEAYIQTLGARSGQAQLNGGQKRVPRIYHVYAAVDKVANFTACKGCAVVVADRRNLPVSDNRRDLLQRGIDEVVNNSSLRLARNHCTTRTFHRNTALGRGDSQLTFQVIVNTSDG